MKKILQISESPVSVNRYRFSPLLEIEEEIYSIEEVTTIERGVDYEVIEEEYLENLNQNWVTIEFLSNLLGYKLPTLRKKISKAIVKEKKFYIDGKTILYSRNEILRKIKPKKKK